MVGHNKLPRHNVPVLMLMLCGAALEPLFWVPEAITLPA